MTDLNGKQLGNYVILHPIGKGGMAIVYSATHIETGQAVAIKVMRLDAFEDKSYIKRFEREARLIGEAKHPHIVSMLDFGQHDDMLYLVMQLLSGGTLAHLIHKSNVPLPGTQVARLFDQVASGLAYAHQRNIIHRDLKPHNVLLDTEQNAYLADFGIAKLLHQTATQATTGTSMIGTPAYMAPEQWQNEPVDERTDIYAMGVLLFELLAGKPPFESDTPLGIMNKHLFEPPPSLTTLRPDIPAGVSQVIDRALAKAPEQRFSSVTELASAVKSRLSSQGSLLVAMPKIRFGMGTLSDKHDSDIETMFTESVTNILTPEQLAIAGEDEDASNGTHVSLPTKRQSLQKSVKWRFSVLRALVYGTSWLIVVALVSGFFVRGTWREMGSYTAFDYGLLALMSIAVLLMIVLPLRVIVRTQQLTQSTRRGFIVGLISFFLPSVIFLIGYVFLQFTLHR